MENYLKIDVKSDADMIQEANRKNSNFLRANGFPDKTVQAQNTILEGLMENAIRYSNFIPGQSSMTIRVNINDHAITVELKKAIDDATRPCLEKLDKTIQFIRGYQDPFEPYMAEKERHYNHAHCTEPDALSLTRIAYRTNATIDFFVSENNILNLSAVRSFQEDLSN